MARLSVYMFPISPDYSGAAAALFDLGGITVMHDASGCTGNYTGYDEPRWLGSRTATYCSGLRRMDAVLGNDEKYIDRTVRAAKDLKPSVICYLGSPVPILIGTDLKGMAAETEAETGVPSFGFDTSGQGYYDKGASDVFLALTKRFCNGKKHPEGGGGRKAPEGLTGLRVNLFGMLPLDFGNRGNLTEIPAFLEAHGMAVNANYAAGLTLEQIRRAADADRNLVLSRSGLALAKYMKKRFGIPYSCGVPAGDGTQYLRKLEAAVRGNEIPAVAPACKDRSAVPSEEKRGSASAAGGGKEILILHEQVFANSLRELLEERYPGIRVRVGSLVGLEKELSRPGDPDLSLEKNLVKELNSGAYAAILGDPELKRVLRREDVKLLPLPHAAVSSKLHWDEYPSYLGNELPELLELAAAHAGYPLP